MASERRSKTRATHQTASTPDGQAPWADLEVTDPTGRGVDVGRYLRETPMEPLSDSEGEFGRLVGLLVTYYIYLLTLLAVTDILAIDALSTLLDLFAGYLPALIGGLLVLLVGIWVAERVGGLVSGMGEGRMITSPA